MCCCSTSLHVNWFSMFLPIFDSPVVSWGRRRPGFERRAWIRMSRVRVRHVGIEITCQLNIFSSLREYLYGSKRTVIEHENDVKYK